MHNIDCDHVGCVVYARNTNGQIFMQCQNCAKILKTPKHDKKLYIKLSEVPAGAPIYPAIQEGKL